MAERMHSPPIYFGRFGIRYSFAATNAEAVANAVQPETKVIVIESPTNPSAWDH